MGLSVARQIAYDCFSQVMYHQRKADTILESVYKKNPGISRLDKNFIKEILYGSLRWYYKIFWILDQTCKKNLADYSETVRSALVCGAYQIYYMDRVPDRASVNESVEYVRAKGEARAVSFVNGILRQIARKSQYFPKPDKDAQPIEYLSLQYSHPSWMVSRWINTDEIKKTTVEKILIANNKQTSCFIRVSPMKVGDVSEFQNQLLKLEKTYSVKQSIPNCLKLKKSPSLVQGSLFDQGYYTIQNLSSQLVGLISSYTPSKFIVDACAGPGGKLSYVYETHPQARIVGVERSEQQYERLLGTLARLGYNDDRLKIIRSDFLDIGLDSLSQTPDKILLDAPCSGLGVLSSHPEGKWQKHENIVKDLAEVQDKLIDHALGILGVGGELVFSVCSFEKEESLDHIRRLKEKYGDSIEFQPLEQRMPDYFKKFIVDKHLIRIYPNEQDEMDGFSCFVVKKLASLSNIS